MFDEPSCRNKLQHEIGVGRSLKYFVLGDVSDLATGKLHLQDVPCFGLIGGLGALEEGEADVDRVAEEDAGEALGDDAGDARSLDGDGGMLPRRAAAKVGVGDDDVALFDLLGKFAIYPLHAVLCQLPGLGEGEIDAGDDDIGINVGAEFMDFAS